MSMSKHGAEFGALCALLMGLISCQREPLPMTEQEAQRVKQFTAQTSPRCVGRYIVDMPKAFVLNERSLARVDGVTIEIKPMAQSRFEQMLAMRHEELKQERTYGEKAPTLKRVAPLGSATGVVFDRARTPSHNLLRTHELVAWGSGFAIKMVIDHRDASYSPDKNDPGQTTSEEKLALLLQVFERTRGRSQEELPSQPGLCIPNGFVTGPATDTEAVQVAFHLEGTPDVYFNLFTQTEVRESTTMLDRSGEMESKMAGAGAKTLRKGQRKIHERAYEEWLVSGPTVDRVPGHAFTLQGNEKDAGPDKPMLEFKLYNGFRVPAAERTLEQKAQLVELTKASLSEAEAVGIWDVVIATVRPWKISR